MDTFSQKTVERVRQTSASLAKTFSEEACHVNISEIRDYYNAEGLALRSSLVVIPFETTALERAIDIQTSAGWYDSFALQSLRSSLDSRQRLDAGESFEDVWTPKKFHTALGNMIVIVDDHKAVEEAYGSIYARFFSVEDIGHEFAHSLFTHVPAIQAKPFNGGIIIDVEGNLGIDNYQYHIGVETPDQEYIPVWIDEAHACYLAVQIRQKIAPDTMPIEGCEMALPEYGLDNLVLPPYLLVRGEDEDNEDENFIPGTVSGAAEAYGFEKLLTVHPSLETDINRVHHLGREAKPQLYKDLVEVVGKELFESLVYPTPSSTWGAILHAINDRVTGIRGSNS